MTILQEDSLGNDIEGANQIKQKSWLFKSLFVFSNCDWHGVHLHVQLSPRYIFNEDRELQRINTVVTIENPFRIKQFSRIFDEDKTDKNDAMRIADF